MVIRNCNANAQSANQAGSSIFTHQKFNILKIVLDIFFSIKVIFIKDLAPMLSNPLQPVNRLIYTMSCDKCHENMILVGD